MVWFSMYCKSTKLAITIVVLMGTGGIGGEGGRGGGAGGAGGDGGEAGWISTATELTSSHGRAGIEMTISIEDRPSEGMLVTASAVKGPRDAPALEAGRRVTVVFPRTGFRLLSRTRDAPPGMRLMLNWVILRTESVKGFPLNAGGKHAHW